MKFNAILIPAIAAAALFAAHAMAEEYVSEEEYGPLPAFEMAQADIQAEPESFDALMSDDELAENRGSNGTFQYNKGIIIGNDCDGCTSGDNAITNSFNNTQMTGIVVQNTGTQAVINANMAVNVWLDSTPDAAIAR